MERFDYTVNEELASKGGQEYTENTGEYVDT